MRKRTLAVLLATVMAGTLMVGCGAQSSETAPDNSAEKMNVEETTDASNEAETAEVPKADETAETVVKQEEEKRTSDGLDSEWLEKLRGYYDSQMPDDIFEDEVFCINEYSDDYRGEFSWNLHKYFFDMEFYTEDDDSICVSIDTDDNEIELEVRIDYEDETTYDIDVDEVGYDKMASILEDISKIDPECIDEDDALEAHDVQTDVLIMYERFIELAEKAMNKTGVGSLADYGLILNSTEKVQASECLSKEVPYVVNEHIFENGKCTDCDMTWSEYMLDAVATVSGDSEWTSHTGIRNEYLIPGDRVTMVNWDDTISTRYTSVNIKQDRKGDIYQGLMIDFLSPDKVRIRLEYEDVYETEKKDENGNSICGSAECEMRFEASPSELMDILSSKDKLLAASEYGMVSYYPGEGEYYYFDDESKAESQKKMEEDNFQMISREELCEVLSGEYKSFLLAIDKSLLEMGTSLKDTGIAIL